MSKLWDVGRKFLIPAAGAAVGALIVNCFSVEKDEEDCDFCEEVTVDDLDESEVTEEG